MEFFALSLLCLAKNRVADPHHLNADPNPAFYFTNPDPAPLLSDGICDHWSLDTLGLYFSLQASIVSVHDPPRLYFEP